MQLDFLIIGSRKCGTTWLYEVLRRHPEICVSTKVKQSNYWGAYFERGQDWYEAFFEPENDAQLIGEVDPDIITSEGSAERIAAVHPDIKLLVLLRHPVDLFLSSHRHSLIKGDIKSDPGETWRTRAEFRKEVCFGKLLKPYYEKFEKEQIRIFFLQDLEKDPREFAASILNYLGVSPNCDEEVLQQRVNIGRQSTFPLATKILVCSTRIARSLDWHGLVNCLKSLGIRELFETSQGFEPVSEELVSEILSELQDDILRLETLTSLDVRYRWNIIDPDGDSSNFVRSGIDSS